MNCKWCGFPLEPGETRCKNCNGEVVPSVSSELYNQSKLEDEPTKKSNKKLLIILIVVAILIIGGVAAFLLLK
jgi:uncharacterized membrane protein YvbJ